MAEMEVVILVQEGKRGELESVARSLEAQGLQVKQTFPRFRTIVGTADSAAVSGMKAVDGVESVRPQTRFTLPPMDDKTPQ
ncbi:hypothetical protein PQJ75_03465 [Rhodoplanes sp. TEM]|uniref:3-deoxy-7-phosphoheptulonate synthase n=1 Tax=Rhodoplanes tepidamans TaxID=200616 RepID=A0ABT5J9X4_RHOTP|nr:MULTISPECIES: hypothetical protein [Rhodoplanes]MDC7786109.1 hypothetical protein [Rhodoplanes tepidamans]MDC7982776.1 hypothetical protein [Rhodoplanes sp. TEM]MDQ0357226.1 hypothetical protein [Rhodoplanes tepidamans]